MTLYYSILGIGLLLVVVFLYNRVQFGGIRGLITKAVASIGFIVTALTATYLHPEPKAFHFLMILGFVLGLLGDVWLDLKWIYEKDKNTYLNAGFISFLCGHICFVTAIFTSFNGWTPMWMTMIMFASFILSVGNLLLEKPMHLHFGKFKGIVFAYTLALSLTMLTSIVAMILSGFKPGWILMSVGGILFALSDAVLSGTYFGENKNTKGSVLLNHILYYAAQFSLASALLFI